MFEGSGGGRLVLGRFGEVVPSVRRHFSPDFSPHSQTPRSLDWRMSINVNGTQDAPLDPARLWRKRYHFNYRLAAQDPTFQTTLFAHDPSRRGTDSIESFEDGLDEGWMTGLDGTSFPSSPPFCFLYLLLFSPPTMLAFPSPRREAPPDLPPRLRRLSKPRLARRPLPDSRRARQRVCPA